MTFTAIRCDQSSWSKQRLTTSRKFPSMVDKSSTVEERYPNTLAYICRYKSSNTTSDAIIGLLCIPRVMTIEINGETEIRLPYPSTKQ